MKKFIASLFILGLSFTITANELHPYENPVPYGDYVKNLDRFLARALARNHWVLTKDEEGNRVAHLVYKGYDVKAKLNIQNKSVALELASAERVDCESCKPKQRHVDGWLIRLRRAIAYELTVEVQKDALAKSMAATNQG